MCKDLNFCLVSCLMSIFYSYMLHSVILALVFPSYVSVFMFI